jgi:predicted nucleic acid-binding protein
VTPSARSLVLDSEGLSKAADRDPDIHLWLEAAHRLDQRVVVPAAILAETVTGKPRDASIHWMVRRMAEVVPVDEAIGNSAGALRERAEHSRSKKRNLTVDAMVAAVARQMNPSAVLTADVDDLKLLCEGADVEVIGV